ncbi:MAG: hypothetical protein ACM359_18375 [Bacillota bacterium]
MTPALKLLFDENFGKPLVERLAGLLTVFPEKPAISHVLDLYAQGRPDDEWIPKVAKEGWIVVSGDRARRYGGAKLPRICAQLNVTHILLSGKLHEMKQAEKIRAIVTVWPQIVAQLPAAVKGTRFSLRLSQHGYPTLVNCARLTPAPSV